MSKRLTDNIMSDYVRAANRMKSKKARRRIVAYVESYDDVYFWRMVLSEFEDNTRYFEVMLPSKVDLTKGKKKVLMNLLAKHVGEDMIACVDADYDYLLQGVTAMSKSILENRYVFHTYAYAIENYQCYAPSLHDLCVMVTLNDHFIFDFEDWLTQYSIAIFPLFVWNIWFYRRNSYQDFSISDFNHVIETGKFHLQSPYQGITNVKNKVGRFIRHLHEKYPDNKEAYLALKDELKVLGVTPETTYLYIQGHHLFDNVVAPMVSRVCETLRREREMEINTKAKHGTQRQNELSCYTHSVNAVAPMLKKNTGYFRAAPYQRLKHDIARYLEGDVQAVDAQT